MQGTPTTNIHTRKVNSFILSPAKQWITGETLKAHLWNDDLRGTIVCRYTLPLTFSLLSQYILFIFLFIHGLLMVRMNEFYTNTNNLLRNIFLLCKVHNVLPAHGGIVNWSTGLQGRMFSYWSQYIFQMTKFFQPHLGSRTDSESKRNEYHESP